MPTAAATPPSPSDLNGAAAEDEESSEEADDEEDVEAQATEDQELELLAVACAERVDEAGAEAGPAPP
jgi:hypothetical protein